MGPPTKKSTSKGTVAQMVERIVSIDEVLGSMSCSNWKFFFAFLTSIHVFEQQGIKFASEERWFQSFIFIHLSKVRCFEVSVAAMKLVGSECEATR